MRAKLIPTRPEGLLELEIDVTLGVTDSETATVADNPVEGGPTLTDEIAFAPREVSLNLVFLNLDPTIRPGPAARSRADRLLSRLRALYRAKALMTFQPPDEPAVRRLAISGIATTRDPSTGHKRPVSVSLRQLTITDFETEDTILDSDLEAFGSLTEVDIGLQS